MPNQTLLCKLDDHASQGKETIHTDLNGQRLVSRSSVFAPPSLIKALYYQYGHYSKEYTCAAAAQKLVSS